jgi:hypothetical protein
MIFYDWNKDTGEISTVPFGFFAQRESDTEARRVKTTTISAPQEWRDDGDDTPIRIDTVFLGIDLDGRGGDPLLFETTVRGLPEAHELYDYRERYTGPEEARRGNARVKTMVEMSIRNAGVGMWRIYGPFAHSFANKLDWDEYGRIVANHLSGTNTNQKTWRALGDEFTPAKETYIALSRAVIEHYETMMTRRNIVQVRFDDLKALMKLLGPARGAMVNRLNKIIAQHNSDHTY